MNTRTQTERIRARLKAGYSITPLNALQMLGSLRLSARIYDLRAEGLPVRTTMVRRDGKRYARYTLG